MNKEIYERLKARGLIITRDTKENYLKKLAEPSRQLNPNFWANKRVLITGINGLGSMFIFLSFAIFCDNIARSSAFSKRKNLNANILPFFLPFPTFFTGGCVCFTGILRLKYSTNSRYFHLLSLSTTVIPGNFRKCRTFSVTSLLSVATAVAPMRRSKSSSLFPVRSRVYFTAA